jgi:hypothetical protein
MASLPWDPDRFATKDDLVALESHLRADMHEIASQNLRSMVTAMVASNATLVGLVLAAVRIG